MHKETSASKLRNKLYAVIRRADLVTLRAIWAYAARRVGGRGDDE
jgi:hypothetical protein